MAEDVRVVAHLLDGSLLKGTALDFATNRPGFHIRPPDGAATVEVSFADLKAVFFVRDFKGKAERKNVRGFLSSPSTNANGNKLAVRFRDGEFLCGHSHTYAPGREGFFMFPADASSNNLRIYVLLASTSEVKAGPAAEVLARTTLRRRTA